MHSEQNKEAVSDRQDIINLQIGLIRNFDGKEHFLQKHSQGSQFDYDLRQDTVGQGLAEIRQTSIVEFPDGIKEMADLNQQMDVQQEEIQKFQGDFKDQNTMTKKKKIQQILKQKKKINKQSQKKFKQKHVKQMPEKSDDLLNLKNELSEKQREKLQLLLSNQIPQEKLDQIILSVSESVSDSESSSSGSYIRVKKSQFKKFNQSFLYERIRNRILEKTSIDLKERILSRSRQQ